jgi:ubiquinone/menaquinone biosynthesis C-methylase UbiE
MSLTVERVSADSWIPPWVRHQHVARYQWASAFAKGCHVIEAACGTGYGAPILARAGATQVDGFDVSAEAIQEALGHHRLDGVRFAVGDAARLPVPDAQYDIFLSLETIEHLEDDGAFLAEVVRVLQPQGTFLCSTPNRALTNPGTTIRDRPFNPHHVREYTRPELESLLHQYFSRVEFFGQSFYGRVYQRCLTRVGRVLPAAAVKLHQARKVLSLPWENFARHWPRPLTAGRVPEILLARCLR